MSKKSTTKKTTKKTNAKNNTTTTSTKKAKEDPKHIVSLIPEQCKAHSLVGNDTDFDYCQLSNKLSNNVDHKKADSTKHEKKRTKQLSLFLEHLEAFPELFSNLLEPAPAPDGASCARMFKALSGDRTPQKENLLNELLTHHVAKGNAMKKETIKSANEIPTLQPGTFNNYMKCLFAELKQHNINYDYEKDFQGSGNFQRVLRNEFARYHAEYGVMHGAGSNRKIIK